MMLIRRSRIILNVEGSVLRERPNCDRIQHDKPVIRGTRVPVVRIIGGLAGGMTNADIDVTEQDIRAALAYASELVEREEYHPLPR